MERMTIAQAAKQLGLTQEAIRQRIRRGTIESHKGEDGRTYVYLEAGEGQQPNARALDRELVHEYIASLQDHIETLTRDRDDWRAQAERKDTIILQLTGLVPKPDEAQKELPAVKQQKKRLREVVKEVWGRI